MRVPSLVLHYFVAVSSILTFNTLGEKILIYQDDTMLFHNSIEEFLKYDYIGAPWPENSDLAR